MNERISVIIPIYNVEACLKTCVDSVLAQTYTNLEILLVDDGSPDGCGAICDEYEKLDPRIRVIHKENGGLSDARNAALDVCRGDIIAFVDSDDFVSPWFIESMYCAMAKHGADIATCPQSVPFQDGSDESLVPLYHGEYPLEAHIQKLSVQDALEAMLYQQIPTGAPFRLYRKHIWQTLRFPKGYLYEDLATTYKAFMLANHVASTDVRAYAYRARKNSITRMGFSEKKMVAVPIGRQLFADITAFDPSLTAAAANRLFAFYNYVFLQIPGDDKAHKKQIWAEMVKYRKLVAFSRDRRVSKKNRIAALLSFAGMEIAHGIGRLYIRVR